MAAQGSVRCSQCRGVFNAYKSLREGAAKFVENETTDEALNAAAEKLPTEPEQPDEETRPLPFDVPDDLPDILPTPVGAQEKTREEQGTTKQFAGHMGIPVLLVLLLLQLAWFERDTLSDWPLGRYLLERLCAVLPCELPAKKALNRILILNREVSAHPDVEKALQVKLVIANEAPFPQPLPSIQLSLFGGDDQLEAMRRFTPREYLPPDPPPGVRMKPAEPLFITLDLVDPGLSVTGYRFAFF